MGEVRDGGKHMQHNLMDCAIGASSSGTEEEWKAPQRPCFPSVSGDEIAVVLHGLRPVIHEVLIHVIGIEQGRSPEGGEHVLGDGFDEGLGMAVLREALEARDVGLLPLPEEVHNGVVERDELPMAEDGGLSPRR